MTALQVGRAPSALSVNVQADIAKMEAPAVEIILAIVCLVTQTQIVLQRLVAPSVSEATARLRTYAHAQLTGKAIRVTSVSFLKQLFVQIIIIF